MINTVRLFLRHFRLRSIDYVKYIFVSDFFIERHTAFYKHPVLSNMPDHLTVLGPILIG
jgi:hypothetical protein